MHISTISPAQFYSPYFPPVSILHPNQGCNHLRNTPSVISWPGPSKATAIHEGSTLLESKVDFSLQGLLHDNKMPQCLWPGPHISTAKASVRFWLPVQPLNVDPQYQFWCGLSIIQSGMVLLQLKILYYILSWLPKHSSSPPDEVFHQAFWCSHKTVHVAITTCHTAQTSWFTCLCNCKLLENKTKQNKPVSYLKPWVT